MLCRHWSLGDSLNTALTPVFQVKAMRETYAKVISDKHEDVMAKFGAILAQGIIDAGMSLFQ